MKTTVDRIEADTSVELAVAIINTLGGKKLEDFSLEVFNFNAIGKRIKKNGILILLVIKDKKVRIEIGYGLENVITDDIAGSIIHEEMIPYFKQGKYVEGLYNGIEDIKKILYKEDIKQFFSMKWDIQHFEEFINKYPKSVLRGDALMFLDQSVVKNDTLTVYSQKSPVSTVVKELKKGDKVTVEFEINVDGENWCGVKEEGQATILGYVLCKKLKQSTLAVDANQKKKKITEELLSLMEIQKNMDQVKDMIFQIYQASIEEYDLPEEAKKDLAQFQSELFEKLFAELSWDNMKHEYISLYVDVFSEDELQAMLDFYKSPVGRKVLEKTPVIMQKAMAVSQERMMKLLPEIQEMTEEYIDKIKDKY